MDRLNDHTGIRPERTTTMKTTTMKTTMMKTTTMKTTTMKTTMISATALMVALLCGCQTDPTKSVIVPDSGPTIIFSDSGPSVIVPDSGSAATDATEETTVTYTVYYIDSADGDDSNEGTSEEKPWRSFTNINQKSFSPGDSILLKRGGVWNEQLNPPPGGTEAEPISIGDYGSGVLPLIDAEEKINSAIRVYNSYVTLQNIQAQNTGNNAVSLNPVGGVQHIKLIGLKIYNAGNNGISVAAGGSNIEIRNCYIENSYNNGIWLGGSLSPQLSNVVVSDCHIDGTTTNDGITIHEDAGHNPAGSNFVIKNSLSENCAEQGIDVVTGDKVIIYNNETRNNTTGGVAVGHSAKHISILNHTSINEPTTAQAAALNLIDFGLNASVRIYNSTVIQVSSYHPLTIARDNVVVAHNNFIWTDNVIGGTPLNYSQKRDNIHFINNIVTAKNSGMDRVRFLEPTRPPDHPTFHLDSNLYYKPDAGIRFYVAETGSNYHAAAFKTAFPGVEVNSLMDVDPKFVDFANDNYRLQPTSPAIDAGQYLTQITGSGTGTEIPVANALFFYESPLDADLRMRITFRDIPGEYEVVAVDYGVNTITINEKITYTAVNDITLSSAHGQPDIGANEYL